MRGQHLKGIEKALSTKVKTNNMQLLLQENLHKSCNHSTKIWSNKKIYYFKTPTTYSRTPTNSMALSLCTGPNEGQYFYDHSSASNLILSLFPERGNLFALFSAITSRSGKKIISNASFH